MAGGELFDRIQRKGHFTERGMETCGVFVMVYLAYLYICTTLQCNFHPTHVQCTLSRLPSTHSLCACI